MARVNKRGSDHPGRKRTMAGVERLARPVKVNQEKYVRHKDGGMKPQKTRKRG